MDNVADGDGLLIRLADLQAAFASSIDLADPAARVPSCGDWRVRDLVEHLASVHHWAAAMARGEDEGALPTGDGLRAQYETCAAELRRTLAELDPRARARTLLEDGTVAFWHRRQVHETLIHLWDLRTAAGSGLGAEAGSVVDTAVWADTVDEVVTVLHPRQVRLGRATTSAVRLTLTATDVGRSWWVPSTEEDPGGPSAAVSGPAEVLALLVWARTELADPRLQVTGDVAALSALLADHFVP